MAAVYGLVGLGLLWLIERWEVTQRRFSAWLTKAAKRRDPEATELTRGSWSALRPPNERRTVDPGRR